MQDGTQRPLTIDDLNLYCYYPQGSIIEEGITCNSNSNFMLQTMPAIRAEIRQKMPWIPRDQPIYLILDNAGGHGTRQAINEYTRQLRDQHDVILKFQPPCSPELNALDLGIWMSLQSAVERRHRNRRRDAEALARTVKEAYDNLPPETITKVFDHLPIVWELIQASNGDNINVEERRGCRNIAAALEG